MTEHNHVPDTPGDAAASGTNGTSANSTNNAEGTQPATRSGSDAVNLAAEQSKNTAGRNIPALDDLPIEADTANLRLGPNLHDGLLALLPLVGVWRGEGQADTPEGGQYAFGQQITFAHDGENYLTYESRIWKIDEEGKPSGLDQRESGFVRIDLKDNIEFICTHSTGAVEILYGKPVNERAWELESASTMVTETGPATLGPGKRLYGLMPNNHLGWVDERVVNGELHPRMSAELTRVVG
ncbi:MULTISPECIES: FABP family protein [unclassified Corynebacterium]|uniref:FABP family protein n=1 Tax=unclassified Corynebacterium TaxID=2624378 RepID=UPI0029CA0E7F|nr:MULTISPECIES: FABP family protein [unclassified Corynebacterium]WPF65757.1 FABP family protein [Corynebacterium sp. 22KM0430]WPF68251.1 FABP family protein [Corynebacterium sp. 21KM1197]